MTDPARPISEPRQIDWSTALVEHGALAVELTGEPSRSWAERMNGVLKQLDTSRWAPIRVTKQRIKVAHVTEESTAELRHLLESAARQTNVDLDRPPAAGSESAAADDTDLALTNAFRGLAPAE